MEFSLKPLLALAIFSFAVIGSNSFTFKHSEEKEDDLMKGSGRPEEYYPAGSSLPDCSHACGPCFPCKRVLVSFKCSVSESCPIVYRCMCKGKFYHIPSAH